VGKHEITKFVVGTVATVRRFLAEDRPIAKTKINHPRRSALGTNHQNNFPQAVEDLPWRKAQKNLTQSRKV
jgi:hypothetical protein